MYPGGGFRGEIGPSGRVEEEEEEGAVGCGPVAAVGALAGAPSPACSCRLSGFFAVRLGVRSSVLRSSSSSSSLVAAALLSEVSPAIARECACECVVSIRSESPPVGAPAAALPPAVVVLMVAGWLASPFAFAGDAEEEADRYAIWGGQPRGERERERGQMHSVPAAGGTGLTGRFFLPDCAAEATVTWPQELLPAHGLTIERFE